MTRAASGWKTGRGSAASTLVTAALILGGCGPDTVDATSTSNSSASSTSSSSSSATAASMSSTSTETGAETQCSIGLDWCDDEGSEDLQLDCDLLEQDCGDEDQKCVPSSTDGSTYDTTRCVWVTGSGSPGDPCVSAGIVDGEDDCFADSFCFGYDAEGVGGVCHPFCTGSFDMLECIDGWQCAVPAQGPFLCLEQCDPLADACGPDRLCLWTSSLFTCGPSGANADVGEACNLQNDCASGGLCVDGSLLDGCDAGCCAAYCSLMAGDEACQALNPNYVCTPFFEGEPPPGGDDLGVCILPQ